MQLFGGIAGGETPEEMAKRAKLEDLEARNYQTLKYSKDEALVQAARQLLPTLQERLMKIELASLRDDYVDRRLGPDLTQQKLELNGTDLGTIRKTWVVTLEVPGGYRDFLMKWDDLKVYQWFVAAIQREVPEFDMVRDHAWLQWERIRAGNVEFRFRNVPVPPALPDEKRITIPVEDHVEAIRQISVWLKTIAKFEYDDSFNESIFRFKNRIGTPLNNIQYVILLKVVFMKESVPNAGGERVERPVIGASFRIKREKITVDGITRDDEVEESQDSLIVFYFFQFLHKTLLGEEPIGVLTDPVFEDWRRLHTEAYAQFLNATPDVSILLRLQKYEREHIIPDEWRESV